MFRRGIWLALPAFMALWAGAASAQRIGEEGGPLRGEAGGHLILAVPVGEFSDYVDLGGGAGGYGLLFVDGRGTFGVRFDAGFLVYGSRTVRVPLSPTIPFVDVDVTTSNWIASFGLGPELVLGRGPVRPYLRGSVGLSYFATTTSVEGSRNAEPFASSTNFDDFTLALVGGGGLAVRVADAGGRPVSLDFGLDVIRHGRTEYLRAGGLREGPGGTVIVEPIRSRTGIVLVRVGVTVGLR